MNRAVSLPVWDGVSRVQTPAQKRAAFRAERARRAHMTPEQIKAEAVAVEVARIRDLYRKDPSAFSTRSLSRYPELHEELADFNLRYAIPATVERRRMVAAQRYAAEVRATISSDKEFEYFIWSELASLRKDREKATGIKWSIDHMYPLQGLTVSGLNTAANLQLIPSWMNFQKRMRLVLVEPDQWIACINRPALLAFYEWSDECKSQIISEYERGFYG